jgi:hypothetical protein|tara:strand:- start:561 stop:704 length:144 start_codon:yes stop_codon:yes gene_type:complete
MWKWLKNLFIPKKQNIHSDDVLDQMSKADKRKLKAEGKIKSIYKPYY